MRRGRPHWKSASATTLEIPHGYAVHGGQLLAVNVNVFESHGDGD